MRVLHLIRRIGGLNRGNIITPRQIESACSARLAHTGHNRHSNDMTKPDLALSQIAARFTRHDVEWSRRAFMINRSPHCQPHRAAASDPGYRSLRAFLLVKRQGAMGHLRKPRPHETNARERSRDRRERSHVPHSTRPISLFRIGQSQAKETSKNNCYYFAGRGCTE